MADVATLLHAYRHGDAAAKDELLATVYPRVRELVRSRLNKDFRRQNRWILAEFSTSDVVQEAFLRVAQNLDQFRGTSEDSLIAYMAMVVTRRLLDLMRHHGAARRGRRQLHHDVDSADVLSAGDRTPSFQAVWQEYLEIYRTALAAFEERHQELLRMRLEEGRSFEEIAELLGYASADVVAKVCRRAKAQLLLRMRNLGVKLTGLD